MLFIIILDNAKLYSELLLHVIYIFLKFYGWYCWTREDAGNKNLIVKSLPISWLGGDADKYSN